MKLFRRFFQFIFYFTWLSAVAIILPACGQESSYVNSYPNTRLQELPDSQLLKNNSHPWIITSEPAGNIVTRFNPPTGFSRLDAQPGSYASWLRNLPLKNGNPPVRTYTGEKRWNQSAHCALIDIDIGNKDLQQCADAVIRLRAEYLYSCTAFDHIAFNFTSGDAAEYMAWRKGYRPVVNGNEVSWQLSSRPDSSYGAFRNYLETVFMYAGTHSLAKELRPVESTSDIRPGDVFIEGGFPGHAVMVMDVAIDKQTGSKVFLLAQSYMPAQDIHVLINPSDSDLSPWYEADVGSMLITPQWTFNFTDLMRFD